jgi:hypothetical protein
MLVAMDKLSVMLDAVDGPAVSPVTAEAPVLAAVQLKLGVVTSLVKAIFKVPSSLHIPALSAVVNFGFGFTVTVTVLSGVALAQFVGAGPTDLTVYTTVPALAPDAVNVSSIFVAPVPEPAEPVTPVATDVQPITEFATVLVKAIGALNASPLQTDIGLNAATTGSGLTVIFTSLVFVQYTKGATEFNTGPVATTL